MRSLHTPFIVIVSKALARSMTATALLALVSCGQQGGIVPTGSASGIPEGLYLGQSIGDVEIAIFLPETGDLIQKSQTDSAETSYQFGPSGLLLLDDGSPIAVGDVQTQSTGFLTSEGVVTSVRVDEGRLVITWDDTTVWDIPDIGPTVLTGTSRATYFVDQSGVLHVDYSSVLASDVVSDMMITFEVTSTGTASR